jgi:hypothetical protein
MRHDMRPFFGQGPNISQFQTDTVQTTANNDNYIQQPIAQTLSCIKHAIYFE